MKKLVFTLLLLPLFLISTMNFYGGSQDPFHSTTEKGFTCSACHATIIDGIIISGKDDDEETEQTGESNINIMLTIPEFVLPDKIASMVVGVKPVRDKLDFEAQKPSLVSFDETLAFLQFEIAEKAYKKENTMTIKHRVTTAEKENGYIEIQGVLSNLDGKTTGDYSFYKKIELSSTSHQKELKLFPSIASSFVSIENTSARKTLKVFDLQGRMVLDTYTEKGKTQIDLSSYENGNYFAVVGQGKNSFQSRFIVSK